MNVVCAPAGWSFGAQRDGNLDVVLYAHADQPGRGAAGASILHGIRRAKLDPDPRAWDLLSIALAVVAADTCVPRDRSPDGWTREIDLTVAVSDSGFWASQAELLETQLRFLTTDLWTVAFADGGVRPTSLAKPVLPREDCVSLLSGGMDSLIGTIDIVSSGSRPFVVSQVARGDKEKQARFASSIGGGLRHLQLNHDANAPGVNERSQRARSIIFLAYAVLAASCLRRYRDGHHTPLYVCENGFIAINPAMTPGRLGSLSTRTAHPVFLTLFQDLLDKAGLRARIENPYSFKTKGEMLAGCVDQTLLSRHAADSTSCGRFARMGYFHCGRCVPCLIRRAAIHAWGQPDTTKYRYARLSKDDADHSRFDDVRATAIAMADVRSDGIDRWLGASLSSRLIADTAPYRDVVRRGIDELGAFLDAAGVK
jgi:hypothetical protein